MQITKELLQKHFAIFADPTKPLVVGAHRNLAQILSEKYPEDYQDREALDAEISKFLADWCSQAEYLAACEESKRLNDGRVMRFTLSAKAISSIKKTPVLIKTYEEALRRFGKKVGNDERQVLGNWKGYLASIAGRIDVPDQLMRDIDARIQKHKETALKAKQKAKPPVKKVGKYGRPVITLKR